MTNAEMTSESPRKHTQSFRALASKKNSLIGTVLDTPLTRTHEFLPTWFSCSWWPAQVDKTKSLRNLNRRALKYELDGDFDMAERFLEQALEISEELYGTSHYRTGMVTLCLAKVSRLKGKRAEAAVLRERAESILSSGSLQPAPGGSSGFWALLDG